MIYRRALIEDLPAIGEYINSRDYFMPIDPAQLGGSWIIAVNDDKICGTIWAFASAPNAYVDYWTASSGLVASKLAGLMQLACEVAGIRYVRGVISSKNTAAYRLASAGLGMIASDLDYKLVFRSL